MTIHCREHLINWLVDNSKDDVLLQNAFRHPGTRVELMGLFDPLPGSRHPGWLVRLTTYRGRKDLIAVVQDHLTRPCRWYVTDRITWDTWQGPNDDVLINGDNDGVAESSNTGRYDRIKKCTEIHTQTHQCESAPKTRPPVVKRRSHPPPVPPQ